MLSAEFFWEDQFMCLQYYQPTKVHLKCVIYCAAIHFIPLIQMNVIGTEVIYIKFTYKTVGANSFFELSDIINCILKELRNYILKEFLSVHFGVQFVEVFPATPKCPPLPVNVLFYSQLLKCVKVIWIFQYRYFNTIRTQPFIQTLTSSIT